MAAKTNNSYSRQIAYAEAVTPADGSDFPGGVTRAIMVGSEPADAEPLLSKADANGYPLWQKTALLWMQYGQPVQPNNQERAKAVSGVEMIDPDSISQPDRVWI